MVMGRGALLEGRALDAVEAEGGARVEARNATLYRLDACGGRVRVCGRVDGLVRSGGAAGAHIVEVKNRVKELAAAARGPRMADEVQVRAYMELVAAAGEPMGFAIIREVFADGGKREYTVKRDAGLWAAIEGALLFVAERFKNLTWWEAEELCTRFLLATA